MKGPAPAEIPAHFTLAWYREQKEIKKTDVDIAEELFISLPLLAKWKKKIGWETEKIYKQMCGRKLTLDVNKIIELKNLGWSIKKIANALEVTTSAIHYHLKKIS